MAENEEKQLVPNQGNDDEIPADDEQAVLVNENVLVNQYDSINNRIHVAQARYRISQQDRDDILCSDNNHQDRDDALREQLLCIDSNLQDRDDDILYSDNNHQDRDALRKQQRELGNLFDVRVQHPLLPQNEQHDHNNQDSIHFLNERMNGRRLASPIQNINQDSDSINQDGNNTNQALKGQVWTRNNIFQHHSGINNVAEEVTDIGYENGEVIVVEMPLSNNIDQNHITQVYEIYYRFNMIRLVMLIFIIFLTICGILIYGDNKEILAAVSIINKSNNCIKIESFNFCTNKEDNQDRNDVRSCKMLSNSKSGPKLINTKKEIIIIDRNNDGYNGLSEIYRYVTRQRSNNDNVLAEEDEQELGSLREGENQAKTECHYQMIVLLLEANLSIRNIASIKYALYEREFTLLTVLLYIIISIGLVILGSCKDALFISVVLFIIASAEPISRDVKSNKDLLFIAEEDRNALYVDALNKLAVGDLALYQMDYEDEFDTNKERGIIMSILLTIVGCMVIAVVVLIKEVVSIFYIGTLFIYEDVVSTSISVLFIIEDVVFVFIMNILLSFEVAKDALYVEGVVLFIIGAFNLWFIKGVAVLFSIDILCRIVNIIDYQNDEELLEGKGRKNRYINNDRNRNYDVIISQNFINCSCHLKDSSFSINNNEENMMSNNMDIDGIYNKDESCFMAIWIVLAIGYAVNLTFDLVFAVNNCVILWYYFNLLVSAPAMHHDTYVICCGLRTRLWSKNYSQIQYGYIGKRFQGIVLPYAPQIMSLIIQIIQIIEPYYGDAIAICVNDDVNISELHEILAHQDGDLLYICEDDTGRMDNERKVCFLNSFGNNNEDDQERQTQSLPFPANMRGQMRYIIDDGVLIRTASQCNDHDIGMNEAVGLLADALHVDKLPLKHPDVLLLCIQAVLFLVIKAALDVFAISKNAIFIKYMNLLFITAVLFVFGWLKNGTQLNRVHNILECIEKAIENALYVKDMTCTSILYVYEILNRYGIYEYNNNKENRMSNDMDINNKEGRMCYYLKQSTNGEKDREEEKSCLMVLGSVIAVAMIVIIYGANLGKCAESDLYMDLVVINHYVILWYSFGLLCITLDVPLIGDTCDDIGGDYIDDNELANWLSIDDIELAQYNKIPKIYIYDKSVCSDLGIRLCGEYNYLIVSQDFIVLYEIFCIYLLSSMGNIKDTKQYVEINDRMNDGRINYYYDNGLVNTLLHKDMLVLFIISSGIGLNDLLLEVEIKRNKTVSILVTVIECMIGIIIMEEAAYVFYIDTWFIFEAVTSTFISASLIFEGVAVLIVFITCATFPFDKDLLFAEQILGQIGLLYMTAVLFTLSAFMNVLFIISQNFDEQNHYIKNDSNQFISNNKEWIVRVCVLDDGDERNIIVSSIPIDNIIQSSNIAGTHSGLTRTGCVNKYEVLNKAKADIKDMTHEYRVRGNQMSHNNDNEWEVISERDCSLLRNVRNTDSRGEDRDSDLNHNHEFRDKRDQNDIILIMKLITSDIDFVLFYGSILMLCVAIVVIVQLISINKFNNFIQRRIYIILIAFDSSENDIGVIYIPLSTVLINIISINSEYNYLLHGLEYILAYDYFRNIMESPVSLSDRTYNSSVNNKENDKTTVYAFSWLSMNTSNSGYYMTWYSYPYVRVVESIGILAGLIRENVLLYIFRGVIRENVLLINMVNSKDTKKLGFLTLEKNEQNSKIYEVSLIHTNIITWRLNDKERVYEYLKANKIDSNEESPVCILILIWLLSIDLKIVYLYASLFYFRIRCPGQNGLYYCVYFSIFESALYMCECLWQWYRDNIELSHISYIGVRDDNDILCTDGDHIIETDRCCIIVIEDCVIVLTPQNNIYHIQNIYNRWIDSVLRLWSERESSRNRYENIIGDVSELITYFDYVITQLLEFTSQNLAIDHGLGVFIIIDVAISTCQTISFTVSANNADECNCKYEFRYNTIRICVILLFAFWFFTKCLWSVDILLKMCKILVTHEFCESYLCLQYLNWLHFSQTKTDYFIYMLFYVYIYVYYMYGCVRITQDLNKEAHNSESIMNMEHCEQKENKLIRDLCADINGLDYGEVNYNNRDNIVYYESQDIHLKKHDGNQNDEYQSNKPEDVYLMVMLFIAVFIAQTRRPQIKLLCAFKLEVLDRGLVITIIAEIICIMLSEFGYLAVEELYALLTEICTASIAFEIVLQTLSNQHIKLMSDICCLELTVGNKNNLDEDSEYDSFEVSKDKALNLTDFAWIEKVIKAELQIGDVKKLAVSSIMSHCPNDGRDYDIENREQDLKIMVVNNVLGDMQKNEIYDYFKNGVENDDYILIFMVNGIDEDMYDFKNGEIVANKGYIQLFRKPNRSPIKMLENTTNHCLYHRLSEDRLSEDRLSEDLEREKKELRCLGIRFKESIMFCFIMLCIMA